jgi:hypothetical protein
MTRSSTTTRSVRIAGGDWRLASTSDSADAMDTIPALPDELSVDVFAELGRVIWAAIKLEDYVEGLCSHINPANPRTDKRQVSTKIRDAQRVLAARTRSAPRDEAAEWLEHAVRRSSGATPPCTPRPSSGLGASAPRIGWASARCLVRAPLFRAAANRRVAERAPFRPGERG